MLNKPDGDYLVDYAVKNLWSNRRLESNVVLKCNRYTTDLPRIGVVSFRGQGYSLPDNQHTYHVYIINAIPDAFLNLNSTGLYSWYTLDELNNRDRSIITLYDDQGLVYPSTLVWLRRLPGGTILMAVFADALPNMQLGVEDLRLRFYRNTSSPTINTQGKLLRTETDITNWIALVRTQQARSGFVLLYCNGRYMRQQNTVDLKVGDYVEFTYDSSIKYVNSFNVLSLKSFLSTQYATRYYLVMNWDPAGNPGQLLYYRNDLTMFVMNKNEKDGRLLIADPGQNSVKQLTFQDVAVKVSDVDYFISLIANTTNSDAKFMVITRTDGQAQRWEGDSNRVTELYRLKSKSRIESIMLGQTASVVEWKADNLMKSAYMQLLESPYEFLDGDTVWTGLGAFAAENVLFRRPSGPFEGSRIIKLSPSQQKKFGAISYRLGAYDNYHRNLSGLETYSIPNAAQELCEIFQGHISSDIAACEKRNAATVTINPESWFKCYVAPKDTVTGKPGTWREIVVGSVEAASYFVIEGTTLTWLTEPHLFETLVRFGDMTHILVEGTYDNTIANMFITAKSPIPYRELLCFINNKPAVEGVDFIVTWPYISITNKSLLDGSGKTVIRLYGMGFPDCDCNYYANGEVGWVTYGLISYDAGFYLRDWRNSRLILGGKALDPKLVEWTEDKTGVQVGNQVNGLPYQISMPSCYTADYTDMSRVLTDRAKDIDLDKRVKAYLEKYIFPPKPTTPPTYPVPYKVYSTFMAALIKAFNAGTLNFTFDDIEQYTLDVLLKDYLHRLPSDPCVNDAHIRWDIVVVDPHELTVPIAVTYDQWRILEAVNKYYLKERVNLNNLLRIGR